MATLVPPATSKPTVIEPEKIDYMDLPCPIPYEEIHREPLMSLKPEHFEGLRFDFAKGLNQKFSLSHSVFMVSTEVPSPSAETIKITHCYLQVWCQLYRQNGRLSARVKCDLSDNLTLKLTNEPHKSHGKVNFDFKSVTPHFSLVTKYSGLVSIGILVIVMLRDIIWIRWYY